MTTRSEQAPAPSSTPPSLDDALRNAERASLLRRWLGDWLLESVLIVVTAGVGWIIWLLFTAPTAQTPAKRLLNVYITDVDTRMPAGAGRVLARELLIKWLAVPFLAYFTLGIVGLLVYGWAVVDRKRQTLYDKVLGTQVVYAPAAAAARAEGGLRFGFLRAIDRLERAIERAYEALGQGNYGRAREQFSRQVERARKLAHGRQAERGRAALGRTLEGRGVASLRLGDQAGAFTDLCEAADYISLGREAALFLGITFALSGDVTAKAIEAYVRYFELRAGEEPDGNLRTVLGIAEKLLSTIELDSAPAAWSPLAEATVLVVPEADWAHFALGIIAWRREEVDKAVHHFELAYRANAEHEPAAYYLGLACLRKGEPAQALEAFRACISLASTRSHAHYQFGRLLLEQALEEPAQARGSKVVEASRALARARQLNDRYAPAHRDYGRCLLLIDDAAGAEAALEQALSLDDSDGIAWFALAQARQQLRRLPAAIEACTAAIARLPEKTDAEELLGDLYFASELWQEAVDAYQRVLTAAPERRAARRFYSLALFRLERYEEAMPGLQETASDSRDAMFALGRCYLRLDRVPEAIGTFRHLIETYGEEASSLYHLGCAYGHAGDFGDAMKAFEAVLTLDPRHERAHIGLGNAALGLGADSEAAEHFSRALEMDANQLDALLGLGTALARSGALDEAMESFQRARALCPGGAASRGCGIIAEMRGDTEEAIGYYRETEDHLRVGMLLCREGRFEEARSHLESALAIGDQSDHLHYHLGKCLAELGAYGDACRHLQLLSQRSESLEELIGRVYWAQGLEAFGLGDLEGAIEAWEEALGHLRDQPGCQQAVAAAYRRLAASLVGPDAHRARQWFARAEELDPGMPYLWALAQLCTGDAQEAATILQPLAEHSPEARYHLGLAHLLAGQAQMAEEQLHPITEQASLDGPRASDVLSLFAASLAAQARWGEAADVLLPALSETGQAREA